MRRVDDLLRAIQEGDVERVERLLRSGVDPNGRDKEGRSALHWAVWKEDVKVIALLLKYGANPNVEDREGRTPLHWAVPPQYWVAIEGDEIAPYDTELVPYIPNPKEQDAEGKTSYYKVKKMIEIMQLLLKHGADPNAFDRKWDMPLHLAARRGHIEVVRLLLKYGADPNFENFKGFTPLYEATEGEEFIGGIILVEHEVEHEADPEAIKREQIALIVALIALLLEHGADPEAINGEEELTALHMVVKKGLLEVVELFLKRGMNPNVRDAMGNTPLHYAVGEGEIEVVKTLLKYGANVNIMNDFRQTPLHIAAEEGYIEIAKLLLDHGADANASAEKNETPLHVAARNGYADLVELFLEQGANPNVKCGILRGYKITRGGKVKKIELFSTPLQAALAKGYVIIAQLLQKHKANLV